MVSGFSLPYIQDLVSLYPHGARAITENMTRNADALATKLKPLGFLLVRGTADAFARDIVEVIKILLSCAMVAARD